MFSFPEKKTCAFCFWSAHPYLFFSQRASKFYLDWMEKKTGFLRRLRNDFFEAHNLAEVEI